MAARETKRLPVEVMMRDEEIMLPGTYEYAERVAARPEVDFNWIGSRQPCVNVYNRKEPYFWVFDDRLTPDQWVRQPPPFINWVEDTNSLWNVVSHDTYPPPFGKELISILGNRASESRVRLMGIHSSGGYITKPTRSGARLARPIYDWMDGDVWKAHRDLKWDYNTAYDTMHRLGKKREDLRIAPPTMNVHGVEEMQLAAKAWPQWFARVAERLPGARMAAQFGKACLTPHRRSNETWEACYQRECIEAAPEWIAERAARAAEMRVHEHSKHSTTPFPDVRLCKVCGLAGSWRKLALSMYSGDPFSTKITSMPYVEPEVFREGAGVWGGQPTA